MAVVRRLLTTAAEGEDTFSESFLWAEWRDVADDWGTRTWDAYKAVPRLGRKTRLGEHQRRQLWSIFERVRGELGDRELVTPGDMYARVAEHVGVAGDGPYQHVVVDEAQDVGVAQLRMLAALAGGRPDGLFFAGDLGQRIFQTPFSWKSLGVDVRGRSTTLKVNYRTSHQIRRTADLLLDDGVADVDGNADERRGTVSIFDGPDPDVRTFDSEADETAEVGRWITSLGRAGIPAGEIAVFVRSAAQLERAGRAAALAGVTVAAMHDAKGMECRAVTVMACDDEVLPLQARAEAVADESDLQEVYATERHLLYVACTRAREHLHVTGVMPVSEFLDDLDRLGR